MIMRRRGLMAYGKPSDYVQDGLILHLDGIQNTRSGQNTSASIWEDLSPMQNDAKLFNMNTDYGFYDASENGYVFLHNNAYAQTINKIGLSGNAPHTVEIVARPFILPSANPPTFCAYMWFGDNQAVEGGCRIFLRNVKTCERNLAYSFLNGAWYAQGDFPVNQIESVSFRTNKFGDLSSGPEDPYILFYKGEYRRTSLSKKYDTVTSMLADSAVQIGRSWQYGNINRSFYGSIQSVRIYNRVLSDEEVIQNYNVDNTRFHIA